jgi:glycosyltransferase involved in cell wall biosynthesis
MKILIAGEASVHVSNYCRAIRSYVDELVLLTETPLDVPEASRNYRVSFRNFNPFLWWKGLQELKKIIEAEKPDLIHVHQVNRLAYFVCLATPKNIPVVATAWGSDVLLVPKRNFLFRYFTKRVIRQSLYVTADARVMIDAMKKMVKSESKYILLQYGIDPIVPVEKEKIIFSNRLHRPLYNIDTIIMDFAGFVKTNTEWKLCIGGSGPETANLAELASALQVSGKVEFLGWLKKNENDSNYARASIYVSIPSSDGTSVSLLEAMSAECIPVVSDLPVTKEWITDGVNGVVRNEAQNPFEEALSLDRAHCIRINKEMIGKEVDRKETTRMFYKIYEEAIRK